MKYSILVLLALSFFITGCAVKCDCGCDNCGVSCAHQCDETRCIPGEKCCENCKCN